MTLDDIEATVLELLKQVRELKAQTVYEEPPAPSGEPPVAPQVPGVRGLPPDGWSRFFGAMRGSDFMGPSLSQDEVDGCETIAKACAEARFPVSWTAYCLATAWHETAATLKPIAEYGKGKGRTYGVPGRNHGQVAYGRGYVQLTWDDNYEKADKELDLGGNLINNYDRALEPDIAVKIMIRGMEEGWFTGKKLETYLPEVADIHQFSNARRIINGLDRAVDIAKYALVFQSALQAGGWQ
jgi:putative chitinase